MDDASRLKALLQRIDGRSYPAWREVKGAWQLGALTLHVDHVQGDPFAAPSRLRLSCASGLSDSVLAHPDRRLAAEDWLLRRFVAELRWERRGSGKSGQLDVYRPGPEVVERSAVRLHVDGRIELRFCAGLPARGRRVLGRAGEELLLDDIPRAARALSAGPGLQDHVHSVCRQRALRRALGPAGLVAFVEDGSVLPRATGVTQAPLKGAVPFRSPEAFRVTLDTPFGAATGMGIERGVTLITGGGFHGKSTLLNALARGHLDHVPGDGRCGVVTLSTAAKVRAEDGRSVVGVDISPFLGELPGNIPTREFSTEDASGSTSQAAAIVEAVEAGAELLLIDEDTSATNLMVRDARMRALIPAEREPITPLVSRVRQMVEAWGVSTVIVVGGVGDYLAVADRVVGMVDWRAADLTSEAKELAGEVMAPPGPLAEVSPRCPVQEGLNVDRVRARGVRAVSLDKQELDLTGVAGVLDGSHARTLGLSIRALASLGIVDGRRSWSEVLNHLDAVLRDGVEGLSPYPEAGGFLVRPRRIEVAAALSRWRRLRVR